MKINLLTKGILLVSIPLCFEISLFGVLLDLQNQLEREAQRVAQGKRTNDAINTILQELIDIGHQVKHYYRLTAIRKQVRSKIANIHANFDELKLLLKEDPQKLSAVLGSEQGIYAVERHLKEMNDRLLHANFNDVQFILAEERRRMNNDFETVLSAGFLQLAEERRQNLNDDRSLEMRKKIRDLLKLALGGSVLLGLFGVFALNKHLTGRLSQLNVNATKLANGEPLLPVMLGDDEIVRLDKSFHFASDQINAAMRKEKAILQNTKDVIMTINDGLSIASVNAAAEAVLERKPDELIGMRFTSLLDEKVAEKAAQYFIGVQKGEINTPLELNIKVQSGRELTMSLSGSYSDAERAYFFVIHDISSAKELELIRREVTAMITHDLKTPLQTVGSFLQMLNMGRIGELSEKGQSLLNIADRSCARMAKLIESVLNLEKIRSGATELNMEVVSLAPLMKECAESVVVLAENKNISIVTACDGENVVFADRHWLQQVLVNLLVNAVHYSPGETIVEFTGRQTDKYGEILVCDQGPGIPDAEKSNIFERFHRLNSTAKLVAGSGLGLSFCKEMVELHNGFIRVEDNHPQGTIFVVGIPNDGRAK